ncbi:MAG TPA: GIY-YIG nuclease family protein [Gammaproteobacteria bacterium]|nr:GIY-YIG nuclease family protein [Gammaproteobacteria bacterium]
MGEWQSAVYILASRRNGTLYIGVTSNLARRVLQHRRDTCWGFTRRYGVHRLVHVEFCDSIADAINREKQMKKWNRAWKLALIESTNPDLRDLWEDLY